MNLVFGIDWKLGALIMIAVMIYCYFSKRRLFQSRKRDHYLYCGNDYRLLYHTGGNRGPDWKASGEGLTHWIFPAGSLVTALGFISTNASLTRPGSHGTYLGKEKMEKDDLFNGVMVADTVAPYYRCAADQWGHYSGRGDCAFSSRNINQYADTVG
ncbi:hypothetical protein LNQ03_14380 [Klebsiella pneumoniae subsp. pneumoniae]|nr:hypothetical protein [Klebsiella pneumoniae subsp. pneumoniae]